MIDEFDIPDLLGGLVGKSLVVLDEDTGRYRLFETVRQYAGARLKEDGEEEVIRRRHFGWVSDLAREAQPHFSGPGMQEWLVRLHVEHGNIRAALSHAPTPVDQLQLASDVHRFWYIRGHLTEGRKWLESALAEATDANDAATAKGLNSVGVLIWSQGDLTAARAAFENSLNLRIRTGDKSGAAAALNNLGLVAGMNDETDHARGYFERAAQEYREMGDRQRLGMVLANLGVMLFDIGQFESAREVDQESLDIARQFDDPWLIAVATQNLAHTALATGLTDEAVRMAQQALRSMAEIDDSSSIVQLLILFSSLSVERGSLENAARLVGASEAYQESRGLNMRRQDVDAREQTKERVIALLPEGKYAACWGEGLEMTAEEAIELALST